MKPIEAHRPTLSKDELESVLDCLINEQLGPGKVVQRFEKSFASAFSYKHALAVNSLVSAYHLAFLALKLEPGARIIMSALAPVQAYDAARYVGAEPVLLDVERNSFHPSNEAVKQLLEEAAQNETMPAAMVLDHTFGSLSKIDVTVLKERGVKIIEDFTGLVGSELTEGYPGNLGQLAVCGLSEQDLLTTGNGAMLVSSSPTLHKTALSMRYGSKRAPGGVAYDYRLSDFQAAMGINQLSRLGITIERRKKIGIKYLETLRTVKHETYFQAPTIDSYLKFPVIINNSHDEVKRYFNSLQIGVTRAVEHPLHHLMELPRMSFPNAERIYQKGLAIPVYPNLTANNVERISASVRGLI